MTFEKLVKLLNFDTGDGLLLLQTDENIEKQFPKAYGLLQEAYLVSVDRCVSLLREMSTKIGVCEELLGLWFSLKLSLFRMYPEYKKRGIDEEYYIAAMANSHRYIAATKDFSGKFGILIDRYVRALSHLIELRAFRVGAFNFEFMKIECDIDYNGELIKEGDTCVSVHIPINTDISSDSVDFAFGLARNFFKKHFGIEKTFCQLYSWLIHPSIAECLPQESKLVKFYNRFVLYAVANNPASPIEYVFGMKCFEAYKRGERNFESYPEKTTLQRKFKERLIKGLPLGAAKGVTLL